MSGDARESVRSTDRPAIELDFGILVYPPETEGEFFLVAKCRFVLTTCPEQTYRIKVRLLMAFLTGKHSLSLARGSAGGAGSWPAGDVVRGSGGLCDGDGEPECFELADVAAGFAAGVDAAGVVAGAEVGEACGGVG